MRESVGIDTFEGPWCKAWSSNICKITIVIFLQYRAVPKPFIIIAIIDLDSCFGARRQHQQQTKLRRRMVAHDFVIRFWPVGYLGSLTIVIFIWLINCIGGPINGINRFFNMCHEVFSFCIACWLRGTKLFSSTCRAFNDLGVIC